MRSLKIGFQAIFLLVISAGILTGGCVNKSVFSETPEKNLSLDNEGIQAEITRLEEITKNDPQSENACLLFLSLCLLYSNPNNEQPDYDRAQEMLETYLSFHADQEMSKDVLYLASLFTQINHLKDEQDDLTEQHNRLRKDAESLLGDTIALKEENGQLASQNKNLKNIIEQLKLLDLRLEERRNSTL